MQGGGWSHGGLEVGGARPAAIAAWTWWGEVGAMVTAGQRWCCRGGREQGGQRGLSLLIMPYCISMMAQGLPPWTRVQGGHGGVAR